MTPLVQTVTNILSFGTVVADVVIVALLVLLLTPLQEKGWGKKIANFLGDHAFLLAFLVAGGGMLGSLFYSQVANFAPCELCWIQRGFLYTEAIILLVALFVKKRAYRVFTQMACLFLACLGFAVGAYHTYLQLGGTSIVPCSITGPSCQYVYFIQYGYVTIPSMALTASLLVIIFMLFKKNEAA